MKWCNDFHIHFFYYFFFILVYNVFLYVVFSNLKKIRTTVFFILYIVFYILISQIVFICRFLFPCLHDNVGSYYRVVAVVVVMSIRIFCSFGKELRLSVSLLYLWPALSRATCSQFDFVCVCI